jgi:hypothetical protein
MLQESFSESWFNGQHIVARRKLKPFCLWHYLYLQFVSSPLCPGYKGNVTWADVELVSRICQLRYKEQIPINTRASRIHLWITMAKSTLNEEIANFQAYIADYFSPPKFNTWKSDKPTKPRGSPPDTLSVASAAIMLFGGGAETERWVWEMPIGQAYWYSSTLHYNRGALLDYMTLKDEKFREFLRSQREKGLI